MANTKTQNTGANFGYEARLRAAARCGAPK